MGRSIEFPQTRNTVLTIELKNIIFIKSSKYFNDIF